jgi:DNA helicase-2/ATP-dependent DNA helicase PcrA
VPGDRERIIGFREYAETSSALAIPRITQERFERAMHRNPNNHPEFNEEQARLDRACQDIEHELYHVDEAPSEYGQKHELGARHRYLSEKKGVLADALESGPYYGRFDFQEADSDVIEELYISKYEGLQLQHGAVHVIYWASPIGSLFAQTSRAKVTYRAPQGVMRGEVFLRRRLMITSQELTQIIDEFDGRQASRPAEPVDLNVVISPDEYLRLVLEGKTGEGLREIVTSIQERQDDILRAPSNQILIVQGPAGSGKSTIALHRVAILLYTTPDQPKQDPARILIIGASHLFLKFVASVLPSLNITNVPQRTFVDWAISQTGLSLLSSIKDKTFDDLLGEKSTEDKQNLSRRSRLKGSLEMIPILEATSQQRRYRVPRDGITILPVGPGSLGIFYDVPAEQIRSMVEATSTLPVNRQRDAIAAQISNYISNYHRQKYKAWLIRIARLVNNPPQDIDQLQVNCWKNQTRAYGYTEIDGQWVLPYSEFMSERRDEQTLSRLEHEIQQWVSIEIPRFSAVKDYLQLLTNRGFLERALAIPDEETRQRRLAQGGRDAGQIKEAVEAFDALFTGIPMTAEDLRVEDIPALTYLQLLLDGPQATAKTYDHILVDEAQDMSPLQIWLLRRSVETGAMTILGDLAQSIHSYRGISQWEDLADIFWDDTVTFATIEDTYRSTFEIMTFANGILASPVLRSEDYTPAKPFQRHGPRVKTLAVRRADHLPTLFGELRRLQTAGYKTIAIICKTTSEAAQLYLQLTKAKLDTRLIANAETDLASSMIVIPVHLAKGIEFDACIIPDASAQTYAENGLDGRMLYVAATRALHELVVMWPDQPSVHLPV